MFNRIRETKDLKGLKSAPKGGRLRDASTWEEFRDAIDALSKTMNERAIALARSVKAEPFKYIPPVTGVLCLVVLVLIFATAGNGGADTTVKGDSSYSETSTATEEVLITELPDSPELEQVETVRPSIKLNSVEGTDDAEEEKPETAAALSSGTPVPSPSATFVFRTYGRAHGVGLCMDGVYYRAIAGKKYTEILNYYYTNVTLSYIDDDRKIRVKDNGGDIHTITMKDYLYHLTEEPDSFPVEGLKTLAVAARTYAINVINRGKHAGSGFDICSSGNCCQAYSPTKNLSAYPNACAAVDATEGQILTYNGAAITAAYCGSCGGCTDNNNEVWGGIALPYLRSKPDSYCKSAPRYMTTTEISVASLSSKVGVGTIKMIDLSDRTTGGRVNTAKITGSSGSKSYSGADFQKLLGVASRRIDYSFR